MLSFCFLSPTLVGMKNISLGPLEQQIMKYVWNNKHCTARDVLNSLPKDHKDAYTTIQTIMTRLIKKGLIKRTLVGKTHVYKPLLKKQGILKSAISQAMGGFITQFDEDALVAFVDGLDDISEETRMKLIRKLQNK